MLSKLEEWFERMPIVAILRGVKPEEVVDIGNALLRSGIGIIEVPLNSPAPMDSIERLGSALGDRCVFGAGTVLTVADAESVARSGGEITVSPNMDPAVIRRSIELGMVSMPGWATASEALAAYRAGARYLKLFPAATYGPGHVKAVNTVLPDDVRLLAVGGVGANVVGEWFEAGISGFGMGTELYAPGFTADQVYDRATQVVAAVHAVRGKP